jgi:hypothetical protein
VRKSLEREADLGPELIADRNVDDRFISLGYDPPELFVVIRRACHWHHDHLRLLQELQRVFLHTIDAISICIVMIAINKFSFQNQLKLYQVSFETNYP